MVTPFLIEPEADGDPRPHFPYLARHLEAHGQSACDYDIASIDRLGLAGVCTLLQVVPAQLWAVSGAPRLGEGNTVRNIPLRWIPPCQPSRRLAWWREYAEEATPAWLHLCAKTLIPVFAALAGCSALERGEWSRRADAWRTSIPAYDETIDTLHVMADLAEPHQRARGPRLDWLWRIARAWCQLGPEARVALATTVETEWRAAPPGQDRCLDGLIRARCVMSPATQLDSHWWLSPFGYEMRDVLVTMAERPDWQPQRPLPRWRPEALAIPAAILQAEEPTRV